MSCNDKNHERKNATLCGKCFISNFCRETKAQEHWLNCLWSCSPWASQDLSLHPVWRWLLIDTWLSEENISRGLKCCLFPWRTHSHRGWFQATAMKSVTTWLGRDAYNLLPNCASSSASLHLTLKSKRIQLYNVATPAKKWADPSEESPLSRDQVTLHYCGILGSCWYLHSPKPIGFPFGLFELCHFPLTRIMLIWVDSESCSQRILLSMLTFEMAS